jgi:hypothetical protein
MKQLIFSILCLIFLAIFVPAQMSQTIQKGFTVERELGSTEKHNYEITLNKGDLLNFVVEQRGVDVVLRIYTADGKFYDRLDSPNETQGDEPFQMVSANGGRYRIEINRWSEAMPTGKYFVKTVEIRQATNAELKAARLKEELLKIVTEDNSSGSYSDTLKRHYSDKALFTNPYGSVYRVSELIEFEAKNPQKLPENVLDEVELSDVKMEDFGDLVVMSVDRQRHYKSPSGNIDRMTNQRISYVFKHVKGEWRIISVQRTYTGREPKPIKLEAKQLDALVGVYSSNNPSQILTITREDTRLIGKFLEGANFTLIPETENTAYFQGFSIAFIRDSNGTVTQAVIYYPMPEERMIIQTKVK